MFHGAREVKYGLPRHMHASRCSCSLAIVQFSPTEVEVEHASCCVGHTLGDVVFHGRTLVPANILLCLPTVTTMQQHAADARYGSHERQGHSEPVCYGLYDVKGSIEVLS